MNLLVIPFLNLILFFYHLSGDNLGYAIVIITILINLLLFPLTKKNMEMAKRQQHLKPKLDELKAKYKDNKTKLFEEQSMLLKKEGINPAAGCLPAIVQIVMIIILIRAFTTILHGSAEEVITALNSAAYFPFLKITGDVFNTHFLFFNLAQKDILFYLKGIPIPGFLVLASALLQFISAKMMMPTVAKEVKVAKSTETSADDVAADFQKQMVYLFPLIYLWIGTQYPSGLALYFLISSVFSVLRYASLSDKVSPLTK